MTAEPAILLDVSRLVSRLGSGPLTGIDRVEAEWLAHLQCRPHLLLCRVPRGQLLLPPRAGAEILRWSRGEGLADLPPPALLERLRGARDPRARARAALRGMALARLGRDAGGLARHLRGHPQPASYVNVGHANLLPGLWDNLRDLRRIVLIHDTIPLDHPEFTRAGQSAKFRARFAAAVGRADLILTISQATRDDVLRWRKTLGLPDAAPVEAVPIGTRLAAASGDPGIDTHGPFFVTLGTIEPRKNHALLLDAWQELGRRLPPDRMPRLYIIGRRGWENHEVFSRLDRMPADGPVRELADLDDGAVAHLLLRSHGLLMPSRAEGFGLPLTEAAGRGIAVLSAPLPAARELLGDYARYLSPDAPGDWADAVADLAKGAPQRSQPLAVRDWPGYFRDIGARLGWDCTTDPLGLVPDKTA
ncbi:Glycosyltransferase involved in cell wall bisynthesis [Paracoccus halophilus]|uniref:Glycosyltransferase involved in cell wall bisynthesis n=1 Tax=Paracoccus halophilus TaxID=376733 RepID=A0A1I0T5P4_9RHOB|nr:glycosyltransferase family 1 protein [Paracoccus halophilus]SFA47017.1 Glycosyltransferase involved in cell wall bisynthesis [Paracoccus halophilus]